MSVKLLQEKIGSTPDGIFGPNTLRKAMEFYKMTPERAAHFFAQTAHETGEYRLFSENLNYSSKGLQAVFGKYFPGNLEESYARQPEKIANRVYGNRMGNGDEESGDGWKYRGRGALQLTGKNNYKAFSEYLEKPEILDNPDLVTEEYAFESALFFFERNNLWSICDKGINEDSIKKLTRRINGGYNGLEHREKLTKKYYRWLKK
jgi:putative chitinase